MASWKQELLWMEVVINMVNSPVVRSFPIFDCRMVSMLMADRVLERWSIIVHKIGIFSHGLLIYSKSRCLLYSRNCLDKKNDHPQWSVQGRIAGVNTISPIWYFSHPKGFQTCVDSPLNHGFCGRSSIWVDTWPVRNSASSGVSEGI